MFGLASALYWSSAAVVGYTYLGYPALISLLARLRPKPTRRDAIEPAVSVVLAARDEEKRLGRKLDNLLALDYPPDKLEIIIVSDGSSDRTAELAASYADRGVRLVRLKEPSGKPTALNRALELASGEIVLFCDARQQIAPDALRALVPHFADPSVGAASGELHLPSKQGPGVYWAYEKLIRAAEGRFDSLVGATGAIYAIRKAAFRPLPADCLLDDVFTPMQIVLQGLRVIWEPAAKAYDEEAPLSGEFSRKARTLAGNYQLLEQLPALLNPLRNRLFFQLVSHKLLRLVCPFALGALLGSNIVLVLFPTPTWPFYGATLAAQVAAYAAAAYGAFAGEKAGRLPRVAHTFVVMNLAALDGFKRYLRRQLHWSSHRTR